MLAEDAVADAERVVTLEAVCAGPVADAGIDDDGIPDAHPLDRVADLIDDAGAVAPHHPPWRDRDAREARQDEQVEMVERGSRHTHPDVSGRTQLGRRDVFAVMDLLETTVCRDGEGAHGGVILKRPAAEDRGSRLRNDRTPSPVCA